MRLPSLQQLRRFLTVDGWQDRDALRGAKTGDHLRFVKYLPDGTRLWTKVSHGSGDVTSADMFKHILRDQLMVTEEQFWLAVDRGIPPQRPGERHAPPPVAALPYDLVANLTSKVGLPASDVLAMSKEEAVAVWQEWLAQHPEP